MTPFQTTRAGRVVDQQVQLEDAFGELRFKFKFLHRASGLDEQGFDRLVGWRDDHERSRRLEHAEQAGGFEKTENSRDVCCPCDRRDDFQVGVAVMILFMISRLAKRKKDENEFFDSRMSAN